MRNFAYPDQVASSLQLVGFSVLCTQFSSCPSSTCVPCLLQKLLPFPFVKVPHSLFQRSFAVLQTRLTVKQSLLEAPRMQKNVHGRMEKLAYKWSRRGHTVGIYLTALPRAPLSIGRMLDTSGAWGKRPAEDCK